MIRVRFYDYGSDYLDVEKELNIEIPVDSFLLANIPEIQLEATDNDCDLEDNWIYWFSSNDDLNAAKKIQELLSSRSDLNGNIKYDVMICDMLD